MADQEVDSVNFMCRYCLETYEVEYGEDEESFFDNFEYPNVCPHCNTTLCDNCGEIIKPVNFCTHCGTINPDFASNLLRTSSTSAAYAEQNWFKNVRKWQNRINEIEDLNRNFEVIYDIGEEKQYLQEVTTVDREREILNKRVLSQEEIEKLKGD